jgi:hypothetical protein
MADIEPGALVEINVAGVGLTRCDAAGSADLGGMLAAAQLRADTGGAVPGGPWLVTANAANPGEVRLVQYDQALAGLATSAQLTGVDNRTPIDLSAWRGGGLWSFDQAANALTITTSAVRTQQGAIPVAYRPNNLVVEVTDGIIPSVLTIEVRTKPITLFADYPLQPQISQGSNGTGTRHNVNISMTGIAWPVGQGLQVRLDFITKGGGGPGVSYIVHKISAAF